MSSIRSRKFEQINDNEIRKMIKGILRIKDEPEQCSFIVECYLTSKEHTLKQSTMLFKQKYKGQENVWGAFPWVKIFSG